MMLPKPMIYKDQQSYKAYGLVHEFCEVCGAMAVDTHHIVFKGMGGAKRDDRWSNLIALCDYHHRLAHGPDSIEWRITFFEIKEL